MTSFKHGWKIPHTNTNRSTYQKKETTNKIIPNDCIRVKVNSRGRTHWDLIDAHRDLDKNYTPEVSLEINSDCLGCTAICLLKIGENELKTQVATAIGKAIAKRLAWEAGKQIIPVAGTVSSVYSGVEAVICFIKCN